MLGLAYLVNNCNHYLFYNPQEALNCGGGEGVVVKGVVVKVVVVEMGLVEVEMTDMVVLGLGMSVRVEVIVMPRMVGMVRQVLVGVVEVGSTLNVVSYVKYINVAPVYINNYLNYNYTSTQIYSFSIIHRNMFYYKSFFGRQGDTCKFLHECKLY